MNQISKILTTVGIFILLFTGFVYAHGITTYPNYTSYQVGSGSNGYCYFVYDLAHDLDDEYCVDISTSPINGQGYAFSYSANYLGGTSSASIYAYYDIDGDGPTGTTTSGYVHVDTTLSYDVALDSSGGGSADATFSAWDAWQYLSCADYVCSYLTGDYSYYVIWDAGADGNRVLTASDHQFSIQFGVNPDSVSGSGGIAATTYASSECDYSCTTPFAYTDLAQADGRYFTVDSLTLVLDF